MGEFILRAAPDVDLYVLYDDGGNEFTAFGTRAEIRDVLFAAPGLHGDPEPRLVRADRHGSSAVFGNRFGGWSTPRLPVFWHADTEGSWWLRRDRLATYIRAMLDHEDDTAAALLEPGPV